MGPAPCASHGNRVRKNPINPLYCYMRTRVFRSQTIKMGNLELRLSVRETMCHIVRLWCGRRANDPMNSIGRLLFRARRVISFIGSCCPMCEAAGRHDGWPMSSSMSAKLPVLKFPVQKNVIPGFTHSVYSKHLIIQRYLWTTCKDALWTI